MLLTVAVATMDYSLLNGHPSSPENLSAPHPYPTPASCYTDYLAATLPDPDRRVALTSPPSANSMEADDALLMDCSRSTSSTSAVTPNPPAEVAFAQHQHRPPMTTVSAAAPDNTKLKLNFSMDRILSRETEFRATASAARFRPVCTGDGSTPLTDELVGGCLDCDRTAAPAPAEQESLFAPVSFSVASMLGLTTGGKPVCRPMPVYLSQSVPHVQVNGSNAAAAAYMSHNAASMYSMVQQQRNSRMPSQLQMLQQSQHTVGIHPASHHSHPHPHQQLHHHHHHLHHHQTPTITIVESACTTTGGGGGGLGPAGSSVAANANNAKRKRSWSRAVFSQLQRKGLEIQFQIQKYITKPDRRKLAARLSLTDAQVKVWFQNRRMKWRHTRETKLGHPQHSHGVAAAQLSGPSAAADDLKHETSSSSDEDDIDVVAE